MQSTRLIALGLITAASIFGPAVAHETPHEVTYLVLTGFMRGGAATTIDVESIPMKSKEACEEAGKRLLEDSQMHTLRKGYQCVDGLL